MSLKLRFWIYLGVIHAAMALVLIWQRDALGWWLLPLEVTLILTLLLGLKLVHVALEPLSFTRTFADVVGAGEYGARYALVGQKEIDRVIETYNRMLSNLQRERLKLGEQRGFLARFLQVTPVGIIIMDFDDRVSLANPRARQLLGGDTAADYAGRALADIESPLAVELAELGVDEKRLVTDAAGRRLRCQRAEFHDRGFPRSYVLIEELTAELNRSERATYEKLIRMISHEVTNTVAATNSLLESCLNYAQLIAGGEHRADYENALNVLIARNRSLNEFTSGLSEIVKLPAPHLQQVDLRDLVSSMQIIFKAELEQRGIALEARLDPDLPRVAMDRSQIEQVMINVIKNAAEACDCGGRVLLAASRSDGVVDLSVLDDGAGIDAQAKANLFTPFYSTKKDGQGIGLTLAKEVLTQHGFGFSLETRNGETCFRMRMPVGSASTRGR